MVVYSLYLPYTWMNYLKLAVVFATVLILSACAWGPLKVTHRYGHLPKIYIETPVDDLRFRVIKIDTISLRLKKKFR